MKKLKLKKGVIFNFKGIELTELFMFLWQINFNHKNKECQLFAEVKMSEESEHVIDYFNPPAFTFDEISLIENHTNQPFSTNGALTDETINFLLTQPNYKYPSESLGKRWEMV